MADKLTVGRVTFGTATNDRPMQSASMLKPPAVTHEPFFSRLQMQEALADKESALLAEVAAWLRRERAIADETSGSATEDCACIDDLLEKLESGT